MHFAPHVLRFLLLAVLTGVPVANTVCGAVCNPSTRPESDQKLSDGHCHQTADVAEIAISAAAANECGTHRAAALEVGVLTALARAEADGSSPRVATVCLETFVVRCAAGHADHPEASRPASTPLGTTPLVLRV